MGVGFSRALVALVVAVVGVSLAPAPARAAGSAGDPDRLVVVGQVTDDTGAPVTGVSIIGEQEDNERFHVADVDADGRYRWEVDPSTLLPELPVILSVRLLGGLTYGAALVDPFYGHRKVTVDFTIPRLARVSGTILDPERRPVADALVEITSDENLGTGQLISEGDGRYRLQVLPGTYFVNVVKPGFQLGGGFVELVAGDTTLDWTLVPEPEPAVKPARPAITAVRVLGPRRVRVRFAAPQSGAPATGFQVRCYHGGRVAGRVSGKASPLAVRGLRPDRRYRCRVRAHNDAGWSRYSPYSQRFRTPARRR